MENFKIVKVHEILDWWTMSADFFVKVNEDIRNTVKNMSETELDNALNNYYIRETLENKDKTITKSIRKMIKNMDWWLHSDKRIKLCFVLQYLADKKVSFNDLLDVANKKDDIEKKLGIFLKDE